VSLRDLLAFSAGALSGHRLRTWLSLLGVSIGVASVVLLTSLGEGARHYVTREFAALGTNLLIVTQGRTETTGIAGFLSGAPNDLTREDAEVLGRRIRAVRGVAPVAFGTGSVRYEDRRRDADIVGSTAEFAEVRRLAIARGRYLPAGAERGARVCVLGPTIARELFRGESPLGRLVRVGDERFRVIGVLAPRGASLGMNQDETVHVPVVRAMQMFNQTSLFRILVEVRSHDEIPGAKAAVASVLRERHGGEEDFTIVTQDSVLSSFAGILAVLTAALAGIAGISLTVAGVGIMNVMLVSVSERTREIGLLKAVGVSSRQVVAVFLTEAAILSMAGGVVGLAGAWAVTRAATAFAPGLPISPPLWAAGAALSVSLLVGLGFGSLPARRAAGLDPVAALARR
jgi:putative ABC transport system permease protein